MHVRRTFTPQGLGSRAAALTITSSANDPTRTVNVTGTGTPPVAAAGIAPALVAFGQAAVGTKSTPVGITVTSTGTASLMITSAALTGNQKTDFILSNAPAQRRDAGAVADVHGVGDVCSDRRVQLTAAVTFTDNAADSPQNVSLTGRGVTPGAGSPFHAVVYCTAPAAEPRELAAGPTATSGSTSTDRSLAGGDRPGQCGRRRRHGRPDCRAEPVVAVVAVDLGVGWRTWYIESLGVAASTSGTTSSIRKEPLSSSPPVSLGPPASDQTTASG